MTSTFPAICVLILAALLSSLAMAQPAPAGQTAQGRAYLDWVLQDLSQIEKDLPAITQAADEAAKAFVEGKNLGMRGGAGLGKELGARAGGLAAYREQTGKPGDIILYAFGQTTLPAKPDPAKSDPAKLLDEELTDAQKLADAGSLVIGIASIQQLESLGQLDRARKACKFLLDNHAPASNGLFDISNKYTKPIIPTFIVANPIVAWTWTGELFAACTRLGKTPIMMQSTQIAGASDRNKRYQNQRFHEDMTVKPIEPGLLGKAYLDNLRGVLKEIGDKSWKNLDAAANRAAETIQAGGKVYIAAYGHYPPQHHGGQLPQDPGLFARLNTGKKFAEMTDKDYAIVIGYSWGPVSEIWGDNGALRKAGRGTAWVLTGFGLKSEEFGPNDILIDQRWAEGDALVSAPGYDVRFLAPSGVTAETILWALTAQVQQDLQAKSPAGNK